MEYNKKQFRKTGEQKILHKVGKHWVSIGLSTLMALGGVAAATQMEADANADAVNSGQQVSNQHALPSGSSALKSTSADQQGKAVSSSANLSNLKQQAANLHTKILNRSLNQSVNSASNGSQVQSSQDRSSMMNSHFSSLNAAVPSSSVTVGANDTNSTSDNAITVEYLDQNNNLVKRGVIGAQKPGTKVDVIDANDGGITPPEDYTFNSNQDPNLVFQKGSQTMLYGVTGKTLSGNINVRVVKHNADGTTSSDIQSKTLKGVVGNTVKVQPKDFVPARISSDDYYYIDNSDQASTLTFRPADGAHPAAYFDPDVVQFNYTETKKTPLDEGLITVHYRDVNYPSTDINSIPIHGHYGDSFDIRSYQYNPPRGYYYKNTVQGASTFGNTPQNVVIMVHQIFYIKGYLDFKYVRDGTVQNVASHEILARRKNQPIDYNFLMESYMPKGYRFLSYDKNNTQDVTKDKHEIIYVTPGVQPAPKTVGLINVNYFYNGKKIATDQDEKKIGSYFGITHYLAHVPQGYKFNNFADVQSQNVSQFTNQPQSVNINVVPINHSSDLATVYVDYLNTDNSNSVIRTLTDQGTAGTAIDYDSYEKSPNLPSGYALVGLGNHNQQFHEGQHEDIYVKPVEQQGNSRIYIYYRSIQNPSQVVDEVSDQGPTGSLIDFNKYKTAAYLPKGYTFFALGNSGSKFENNAKENILVKPVSNPQPSDHQQSVTGTIVYRDNKTGAIKGQTPITGTENTVIDYGPYTRAGSPYMPDGYQFAGFGPHGQYLEQNAKYVILVKATHPIQQKGTIDVNYQDSSDDNRIVQNYHLQDPVGTSFNVSNYVNQIPSGYTFKGLGSSDNVSQFTDQPQSVNIIVSKQKPSVPQINGTLVYQDAKNGSDVNTLPLNGPQGTSVNYKNYINSVPNGYTFDKLADGDAKTLRANGQYVILVNKNPQIRYGIVTINFRDGQGNNIRHIKLRRPLGTDFNDSIYTNFVPQGYIFGGITNGNQVKNFGRQPQSVDILINKPRQQQIDDPLIYQDINTGKQVGKANTIRGVAGQQIDFSQYLNDVPQGYHWLSNPSDNTLESGRQYVILVAPNQPTTQYGSIQINYRNASDRNQLIASHTLTEPVGSAFGINDYLRLMPAGYDLHSVQAGANINSFTNGDQTVNVLISAHHNNVQPSGNGTITVMYVTSKNGVISRHVEHRPIGALFSGSSYLKQLPAGYKFGGIVDGNKVSHFTTNPQSIVIQVDKAAPKSNSNPIPAPNPLPNSSSAMSSSAAPSPAPAPSSNGSQSNSASSSSTAPSSGSNSQSNYPSSNSNSSSNAQSQSASTGSSSASQPSSASHRGNGSRKSIASSSAPKSQPSSTGGHNSMGSGAHSRSNTDSTGDAGDNEFNHDGEEDASSHNSSGTTGSSTGSSDNDLDADGASSQDQTNVQNNNQNRRLPQTGERMNGQVMDAFAWLALASLIGMWGSATDRRRQR